MRSDFWNGKSVFLTGHTGFKGSWLSLCLSWLGAKVTGYALPPAGELSLYQCADVAASVEASHFADVRDLSQLTQAMQASQPDIVFHLAAQPLVRASYRDPIGTWTTNVIGTANVLESVRACKSVKAVVVVTTDKCYENREWAWGYRETDPLGGHDPYSASKAGTELVAASYRRSFLEEQGVLLATARAGNVIGGGDWSEDRLIPDADRAIRAGKSLVIRSPAATRPWQHVLEPLSGYLMLAERLYGGDKKCAQAFNFGPGTDGNRTVLDVLEGLQKHWPELSWKIDDARHLHEAGFLFLDASLARAVLNWKPHWAFQDAIALTAHWYRRVSTSLDSAHEVTREQIKSFFE